MLQTYLLLSIAICISAYQSLLVILKILDAAGEISIAHAWSLRNTVNSVFVFVFFKIQTKNEFLLPILWNPQKNNETNTKNLPFLE